MAKREGAHPVFDHRKAGYQEEILQATDNRGVDIILEMLANVNLSNDMKLLAGNGRVIVIGSRGEVTINPRELMGGRFDSRVHALGHYSGRRGGHPRQGCLQASKTVPCDLLLARNCCSPMRCARTRRFLSQERPARSCSPADR